MRAAQDVHMCLEDSFFSFSPSSPPAIFLLFSLLTAGRVAAIYAGGFTIPSRVEMVYTLSGVFTRGRFLRPVVEKTWRQSDWLAVLPAT